jgi:hypothetical protein
MNNAFRKGFHGFTKSFFNNKYQFNTFNSKTNQNHFRINFANKSFITNILGLNNSYSLISKLTNGQIISGAFACKDLAEGENADTLCDANDGVALLGELFYFRDDCKWTCGNRMVTGPQSPVIIQTEN